MRGDVNLYNKKGDLVGNAVIMSDDYVMYQLYKNIRDTYTTDLKTLLKKYKVEVK